MEPWGGKTYIQSHPATFPKRQEDPFPSLLSFREENLKAYVIYQAVALGKCLVAAQDEKPGVVMTQVPAPPQAFKCEMSSETREMSNPSRADVRMGSLSGRLPGTATNFEVMLWADKVRRLKIAQTLPCCKTQSGSTSLWLPLTLHSLVTQGEPHWLLTYEEQWSGMNWWITQDLIRPWR